MKMDHDFDKDEILEAFRLAKFKHTRSARLILSLSYGVDIQLSRKTPLTFDSIEKVTIRRIWPEGITPQYPQSRNVKTLGPDYLGPKTFAYNRHNNVGNSLALLVILALKIAYDEVRKAERPGLLFMSEIFNLQKLGLWNKKDCKLDNLVSRLRVYWNYKSKKMKGNKTEEARKLNTHNYTRYPLVDEFLIDGQEIYNLVCWEGGNEGNKDDSLIQEKVWVLNAHPSQVRVFTPAGSELRGEALKATLSAIFPEQSLITESTIREYEGAIADGRAPFFQGIHTVTGAIDRESQTKEISERWKTVERYAQPMPPEIVDFRYVFTRHPKSEFVGRVAIKRQLDDFVQHSKPNTRYFLIVGDAGVGKTALIANYVREHPNKFVHYFIEWRKEELDSPTKLFGHIYCALSRKYELDSRTLPNDTGVILEILKQRIREISETRIALGEREIIFIDGLDETTSSTVWGNTISNLLFFDFPDNFGFVISTRSTPELRRFIEGGGKNTIHMNWGSKTNMSDLSEYLSAKLRQRVRSRHWIDKFVRKSRGSFVYASLLVEMIMEGKMTLKEAYDSTPQGLNGIYEQGLRIIEGE